MIKSKQIIFWKNIIIIIIRECGFACKTIFLLDKCTTTEVRRCVHDSQYQGLKNV